MAGNIHPTAILHPQAKIGANVSIGAYTVIHEGVELGDNAVIQEHCIIGVHGLADGSLRIGDSATIRSHTVIYRGSEMGPGLETGHHVVIRELTRAGINLRVGNFCDVEGNCEFGDYTRLHGYAHVGKGTKVGHFVWLFSLTTSTNDPIPPSFVEAPVVIEDGAVICVAVTLMPGTTVGKGAFVSAGSIASGHVPPGAVVVGAEGRVVNHVSRLMHLATATRHPWMRHYKEKYPKAAWPRIEQLLQEVLASARLLELEL